MVVVLSGENNGDLPRHIFLSEAVVSGCVLWRSVSIALLVLYGYQVVHIDIIGNDWRTEGL